MRPAGGGAALGRVTATAGLAAVGGRAGRVDAVTLGAAEGVLDEFGMAVAVQNVFALTLVVGAVGLLHVLAGRGLIRLGHVVVRRAFGVLVGGDSELSAGGHVQLVAVVDTVGVGIGVGHAVAEVGGLGEAGLVLSRDTRGGAVGVLFVVGRRADEDFGGDVLGTDQEEHRLDDVVLGGGIIYE